MLTDINAIHYPAESQYELEVFYRTVMYRHNPSDTGYVPVLEDITLIPKNESNNLRVSLFKCFSRNKEQYTYDFHTVFVYRKEFPIDLSKVRFRVTSNKKEAVPVWHSILIPDNWKNCPISENVIQELLRHLALKEI
jgi:hypothetical protein